MANYIISNINEMKQFLSEQLPEWEKTTAETLLTTLSHSDNQLVKETAEWIKVSSQSEEKRWGVIPKKHPLFTL